MHIVLKGPEAMHQLFFFFPRFKNRNTSDNRGADFQNFLQLQNFADLWKTDP